MTMIEKMALATMREEYHMPDAQPADLPVVFARHCRLARAALTALLEPSEGMWNAALSRIDMAGDWIGEFPAGAVCTEHAVWVTMIQHALDEGVREDG